MADSLQPFSSESGTSPLEQLATEAPNPATGEIDKMNPLDIARLMNAEDTTVPAAVRRELPEIARAMEAVADRLRNGGRLLYIGAGSSGRIGSLDAYECPATFNVPKGIVISCVAGDAPPALSRLDGSGDSEDWDDVDRRGQVPNASSEHDFEDDAEAGASDLAAHSVSPLDAIVGITASGRTPYVLGALRYAQSLGALTIGLACNRDTPLARLADIVITPLVGPEVIAGSTRLKAGTAQKMVLNMLTTGAMVLLGKTYGNLMVDVQATNAKLRERAIRIVEQATGLEREKAAAALAACDHETKTAILAERAHLAPEQARQRLAAHGDKLRAALEAKS